MYLIRAVYRNYISKLLNAQIRYFCGFWSSVILWILDLLASLQDKNLRISVLLYLVDEVTEGEFCRSLENHVHVRFLLNLAGFEGTLRDLM